MLQHQGAVAARQRFRQELYRLTVDAHLLQVDKRHLQVLGQEAVQRAFRQQAEVCEHAPKFAPGALLFGQCAGQLLLGDDLLLHQQLAEPDFPPYIHCCGSAASFCHCSSPVKTSA